MRSIIIIAIALLFLNGCGSGNLRDDAQAIAAREARAVQLYTDAEFAAAAAEFLALAKSDRERSIHHRLSAADAFLQNRDVEQTTALIQDIEPGPDNLEDRFYLQLLSARFALLQGRPEEAGSILQQPLPSGLSAELLKRWYITQVDFNEKQQVAVPTVLARIHLENYLDEPAAITDNSNRIWELLQSADPAELNRAVVAEPDNLRPWLELAALNRAFQSGNPDAEASLRTWSASYPDHPANAGITSRLQATGKNRRILPNHIALLLPLSGAYQTYSEKIRDGFLAAWFSELSYKPVIRIYDTDNNNVREKYQQAINAGADFVVGPLQKEAVKALMEQPLPVRILALNQIENTSLSTAVTNGNAPVVQFGLPPEDEAREVAERAMLEGHTRVLVIAVADEFGDRVVNAFSEAWTQAGGRVLERINYDIRKEEFVAPVKQLLNIDSSESRIALLRKRLGRGLNSNGRLRNDADFIFMVAPNLTARQIVPHLQFFGAASIPVYSVSSVYNGTPDPQTDIDLNNVEFVDMPWLLDSRSDIHIEVARTAAETRALLPRYFAFGVDAFRLIPQLGLLSGSPDQLYSGETGSLFMTEDGIIHRHPAWARFVEGVPRRIDPGATTQ